MIDEENQNQDEITFEKFKDFLKKNDSKLDLENFFLLFEENKNILKMYFSFLN